MTANNGVRPEAAGGLSRRTLVVGAAWGAPVVVMGLSASPAAAVSAGGLSFTSATAAQAKNADGTARKGYVTFTVTGANNSERAQVSLMITSKPEGKDSEDSSVPGGSVGNTSGEKTFPFDWKVSNYYPKTSYTFVLTVSATIGKNVYSLAMPTNAVTLD